MREVQKITGERKLDCDWEWKNTINVAGVLIFSNSECEVFSSRFSVRAAERELREKALAVSSIKKISYSSSSSLRERRDSVRKGTQRVSRWKWKAFSRKRKSRERELENEWVVCLLIKDWKERKTIVKVQREKCLRHQRIVRRPYHCLGFHTRKKSMTNNKSWPNFFKFQPTQFPASVPFILSKLNFYDEIKIKERWILLDLWNLKSLRLCT